MVAAFDLTASVQTVSVFKPMNIITHDCRVVRPAFRGYCDVVVTVKKSNPVALLIYPSDANQFRTQAGNNDPQAVLLIGQNVEVVSFPVFFSMRKLHRSCEMFRL